MGAFQSGSLAERNRFDRVVRIPTPTPLPVGDINAYLILPPSGSDSLTLIDTGVKSPEAFEALRQGFKAVGFSLEQVDRLLLTHAHLDHFGQARRIQELSGATVYASRAEAERMTGYWSPSAQRDEVTLAWFQRWGVPDDILRSDGGMREMARRYLDPIEVDVILEDGERVEAEDFCLEAIWTPGHCEGHLVFYERDLRLLFSGDHLLTDISPVPLLVFPKQPDQPRPKSLARFMDSLERVEALECRLTFPSHGDVIRDHREIIAGYRLHHEKRKLQMLRALERGPMTPFQLGRRLFPKHYRRETFLVMSEVVGHLDLLLDEGAVALESEAGVERVVLLRATREAAP